MQLKRIAINTIKSYSVQEFTIFKFIDEPLDNNLGTTLEEKYKFIYFLKKDYIIIMYLSH